MKQENRSAGEEILAEARNFFGGDRYAVDNGAVIEEVGDHYARCSISLGEKHRNAVGNIMGGVHFTLADFTFAVAANRQEPGVVTLSANITYLSAIRGEKLIAEAHCIREGRTTNFYQIDLTDELGTHVAVVTMTGYRKA